MILTLRQWLLLPGWYPAIYEPERVYNFHYRHECLPIVDDEEVIARLSESTEILQRSYKGSTTIYGELKQAFSGHDG